MLLFYQWQLASLALACGSLLLLLKILTRESPTQSHEQDASPTVVARLSRQYLCVYVLVMGTPS